MNTKNVPYLQASLLLARCMCDDNLYPDVTMRFTCRSVKCTYFCIGH